MSYKYKSENMDWVNTIFLIGLPILTAIFTVLWIQVDGFSWGPIIIGLISYQMSGMGITMGYHRLYSHRSYDAPWIVRLTLLLMGAGAVENSLLAWGSDHRRHHAKVDTPDDPYNINEGFFWAHMGWILHKKQDDKSDAYGEDFRKDPLVMWQDKYYLAIAIMVAGVLPVLLTWYLTGSWLGGIAMAAGAKVILIHHCTFFINSLCHYAGKQTFTDTNTAKDSWWVALVSFGEGFHNFHHYFQTDYRNGIRWYDYDPSKWAVGVMSKIGLASNVKVTPKEKIVAAELNMKMQTAKIKLGNDNRYEELEKMKARVISAIKDLQSIKNELRQELKTFQSSNFQGEKLEEMKKDFRIKQLEFKNKMKIAKEEMRIEYANFKEAFRNLEMSYA